MTQPSSVGPTNNPVHSWKWDMAEQHGNSFSRLSRRWKRKSDPGSVQAVGPNGRRVIKTAPMGPAQRQHTTPTFSFAHPRIRCRLAEITEAFFF